MKRTMSGKMSTRVKQRFLFLLFLLPAVTAALAADLPSAWRSWRYSRRIESLRVDTLNYVTLDREVLSHSENRLDDLRIIDDAATQLPYELRSQITPPPEPVRVPATLRENSFVPGQFTQLVVDLGEHP